MKPGHLFWVFAVAALTAHAGSKSVQYAGSPNHREMAVRACELARSMGFTDSSVSAIEIQSRIEAGAYSEDFEPFSAAVGVHYPAPWDQGPNFDFGGYYNLTKIPYGLLADDNNASGWFRGLPHGFDPKQGFRWPGAAVTTIEWANATANTFTWDNAVLLYRKGSHAEAYECLGHLLHLLMDLSIPAHVTVVDHGMHLSSKKSGWPYDPDLAVLVVDEYEMALAGGIELSGVVTFIPDVLGIFRAAVRAADTSRIPRLPNWTDYFTSLAMFTYEYPAVKQYYVPPMAAGLFGQCKNQAGGVVQPRQYGITLPTPIDGRWTQVEVLCTASMNNGSILPAQAMEAMCHDLVPKAVEYCAGLILQFSEVVNMPTSVTPVEDKPVVCRLEQNYPNPFNPKTVISYELSQTYHVKLVVYDVLGRAVAVLVNEQKAAGHHQVEFNGSGLSSGVYFCRLSVSPLGSRGRQAGSFAEVKKMSQVK